LQKVHFDFARIIEISVHVLVFSTVNNNRLIDFAKTKNNENIIMKLNISNLGFDIVFVRKH